MRHAILRPTGVHLIVGGDAAMAAAARLAEGGASLAVFVHSPNRAAAAEQAAAEFSTAAGVEAVVSTLTDAIATQMARRVGPGGLVVVVPDDGVISGMGETMLMATLNRAARTTAVVAVVPRRLRGRAEAVYTACGPTLTARGGVNPVAGYGAEFAYRRD